MNPSLLQQCPSCSRIVQFSHEDTTILQCTCGAVIHRKEGGILLVKAFKIIFDPPELITPGSYGKWEGRSFKITGRFRAWFDVSVFNYWTIVFDDGELAYLAEGYGLYAILRKTSIEPSEVKFINNTSLSGKLELIKGRNYLLEKRAEVERWDIEGELYLPECNDSFRVYEFAAPEGNHITVFQFLPHYFIAFEATFIPYGSLNLTNAGNRELSGKSFSCIKCKNEIRVKTWPYAQSCACPACGTQYALNNFNFKPTGKTNEFEVSPAISLGSTGIIDGITYECIGFTQKEENNKYHSRWNEYVIYNREEGYAFLSEYNGNWTYVREQGDAPVLPNTDVQSFEFNKESFLLYNSYTYKLLNAQGEFPYNIFTSGNTKCNEFISPPEVWVQEINEKEGIVWFLGQHISGNELEVQFGASTRWPAKEGVGAVEPLFYISPPKLIMMGFLGILLLSLLHVLTGTYKQEKVLLSNFYEFSDSSDKISFATPPVHFNKWRSNLEFEIDAPVDNDWFELDATLVNIRTGTEYTLEKGVEYYHGYSEGESWSEGSTRETAYFTYLPAGDYILQVQGIRNTGPSLKLPGFQLKVTYDVSNNRNLWWCLAFVLLWPVIQYYRTRNIEKKRWYNSPFSPYNYEDED